jgi:hypothetical protein
MDIFGLKAKTADKFIKKRRQNPGGTKKSLPARIGSVGVVADIDLFRIYDFTPKLIADFGLAPNQVQVVLLDPAGINKDSLDAPESFDQESFGLYGKVKNPALEEFVSRQFDLLINYSSTGWIFTQVILVRSQARLKAGFDADRGEWQDISIKVPVNDIDTFHEELLKYLKIMNLISDEHIDKGKKRV